MGIRTRVLEASEGRDRVRDAVKALALGMVVLGHSVAWTTTAGGGVVNTLDAAPGLAPLTWVMQILPVFFLMAGAGLVRITTAPSITDRIVRLVAPALPLLVVVVVGSTVLQVAGRLDLARAFGLAPVQLVWFLGVYLLLVAAAPWIRSITTWWQFALWILAICAVDLLRIQGIPLVGWLNLIFVWGLFAALGLHLDALRRTPRPLLALGAIVSGGLAVILVLVGPYSRALISTDSVPGLSNLAPPTIVLAAVGIAQICLLLAIWPLLARVLDRDRPWIAVAVFASRAMQIYLFHMLAFTLVIGMVIVAGWAPVPLDAHWWLLHLGALITVVATVWFASPALRSWGEGMARLVGRCAARRWRLATHGRSWLARTLAALAAVSLLMTSEAGLSEPIQVRSVLDLPYVPLVALGVIAVCVAMSDPVEPLRPT